MARGSSNSNIGTSLAVGDVNADGFDDVVIGAPYRDGDNGAVYVVYGPGIGSIPLLRPMFLCFHTRTTRSWAAMSGLLISTRMVPLMLLRRLRMLILSFPEQGLCWELWSSWCSREF